MIEAALMVFYAVVCLLLIAFILLQRGKEAGGGIFGQGSTAVISAKGTNSLLIRTTSVLGGLFFSVSLLLGFVINQGVGRVRAADVMMVQPTIQSEVAAEQESKKEPVAVKKAAPKIKKSTKKSVKKVG